MALSRWRWSAPTRLHNAPHISRQIRLGQHGQHHRRIMVAALSRCVGIYRHGKLLLQPSVVAERLSDPWCDCVPILCKGVLAGWIPEQLESIGQRELLPGRPDIVSVNKVEIR